MSTRQVGKTAEDLACRYLDKLGYKIVSQNYQIRDGEIDIIAWDKEVLVFIEVKARFSHEFGTPLEAITPQKIRNLIHSANLYVHQHKLYKAPLRMDALGIDYTLDRDNPQIELVKNILN